MKAWSITLKDLQILFKDRGAIFQLFLLPLLFVVVFSGALGEVGKDEPDTRVPLPVVNLDGGPLAQALIDGLEADGGLRLESYDQTEAQGLLDEKEISRVLTVPTGFSAGIDEGRPVALRLVNHPDANPEQTEAVRLVIEGVANDMSLEIQLLAALQQMGEMQNNAPAAFQEAFSTEKMQAQARSQFERAQVEPLVAVRQRVPGQETEQEEALSVGEVAVPGITVLFCFLASQMAARSIYDEKKVGSFRRLLAAPVSKIGLLAGKMLPNLVACLVQAAIIFLFGIVGLRLLGLPAATLGSAPLATVLVVVLIALCSSAFGILIAALARTENQIGGLSTLLLWGMGLLGGSFIPLFLLERFLGPLPKIVPHYWATHALVNLMVRGLGWGDVALDMAVLLGFTVLFFAVGLWRFDFD